MRRLAWALVCLGMVACSSGGGGGDDVVEPDAALDDNATLAALTASAGVLDPPFEPEIAEYHLDLLLAEAEVALTATAAMPVGTAITVDGAAVDSGAASGLLQLAPGDRDIDIVVTAAGGGSSTYRVHVHRGVDVLASLVTSTGTLVPAFEPTTTAYAMRLPLDPGSVAITPTLQTPGRATITVGTEVVASGAASTPVALASGDNVVEVTITPVTRAPRTYATSVFRGTDALASLELSYAGASLPPRLTPAFTPTTSVYAAAFGVRLEKLELTVATLDPAATVTVAGGPATSGQPAAPIALNLGATTIPIVVTAPDSTQRTYTVNVTRSATPQPSVYAKASNTGAADNVGRTVAIWGDTMVVGAPDESSSAIGVNGDQLNDSAGESGAAYVFTRTGSTWTQQAYLKASNTGADDNFGMAVAIWDDTIVVSAPAEDSAATGVDGNQADNSSMFAGAAYVFTRTGSTWSQQAYLKASNTAAVGIFGHAVALWGDTIAVSAPAENSDGVGVNGDQTPSGANLSGSVYVFTRTGTTWAQQAYVKASNTGTSDQFGQSVALWDQTLAIGAIGEDSAATGIDGNQGDNGLGNSGAVYVLTRTGTDWTQQAYLKASNTGAGDSFGASVSLWGDRLAVGAPSEDGGSSGEVVDPADNSAANAGAVYVFARVAGTWSQQRYLKASNTDAGDGFGADVALRGDGLAISASAEDSAATGVDGNDADDTSADSGAVYVFSWVGMFNLFSWRQTAYHKASNTGAGDGFGGGIAQWGDTLVIGAQLEDSAATGLGGDQASNAATDAGAAYVFP